MAETPRVHTIVSEVPCWQGHAAGQHVGVRLTAPDGYQPQRSYSIASPPEAGQRVALTVERLEEGEVSSFLVDELQRGDRVELRGPIGGYFVWNVADGGPLLLVAGGSGIVPLMAMLRHRAARGSTALARLLYWARSLDEVIYRDELDRLAAGGDGLTVTLTLTRSHPPGWSGVQRRIDTAMLAAVAWPPGESPLAFVCGPTLLVKAVAQSLVELGHDQRRIKTERFGPTGG